MSAGRESATLGGRIRLRKDCGGAMLHKRFGEYQVVKKIGSGGMADIFLALKRGLGRYEKLVALKMISAGREDAAELRAMFQTEAQVASRFNHPHVVQLYDLVHLGTQEAMVMEYTPGHTLDAILQAAQAIM